MDGLPYIDFDSDFDPSEIDAEEMKELAQKWGDIEKYERARLKGKNPKRPDGITEDDLGIFKDYSPFYLQLEEEKRKLAQRREKQRAFLIKLAWALFTIVGTALATLLVTKLFP